MVSSVGSAWRLQELPPEVETLLRQTEYINVARTRCDINAVLVNFERNFTPKIQKVPLTDYIFKKYIYLDGSIVAQYNGIAYTVPLYIWIPETYPVCAPVCYVYPTAAMNIAVPEYVAENGRVSLPYIDNWHFKGSNLVGLIKALKATFDKCLPLFVMNRQTLDILSQPPYNPNFRPGLVNASYTETDGASNSGDVSKRYLFAIDEFMIKSKLKETEDKVDGEEKKD